MKISTAEFAVHAIGDRIGVSISAKMRNEGAGDFCELTPTDLHPNEGFSVQFRLGWRSAEAVFVPGPFSGPLIQRMGKSTSEGRQLFAMFAKTLLDKKIKITMRVNSSEMNPVSVQSWPLDWSALEFNLKASPIVVEPDNAFQHENLIVELVIPTFGMLVSLIGADEAEHVTTGELEGRAIQSVATRYERNRLNREACIQLKGCRCVVCGFDFAKTYGPIGVGYIEVHHLKSLASVGPDYRIDVASDLAPVCSNCHSMAHREDPAISLERLRELINARQSFPGKESSS